MASRRRTAVPAEIIIGPAEGGNTILAAWQGLYHLFGARVTRFDISSEGVSAVNLTFDEKHDAATLIRDITTRNDKLISTSLSFLPAFFWALGEVPEPFTTAKQMTNWMVRFLKGAGEDSGRSPKYAKTAIESLKGEIGILVPRGRPRKTFSLDSLSTQLDERALENVPLHEVEKLKETIENTLAKANVPAEA